MKKKIDFTSTIKLCWIVVVSFIFVPTTPVYAYGPYVHYQTMRKAHYLLVAEYPDIPVLWRVGGLWDQIEADLHGPSHGCDVDPDNALLNGNLTELVQHEYLMIKSGFIRHLNGEKSVDISKHTRRLSHYIADGMSIGQISGPSLWGWKDDRIDLACEAVSKKRSWPSHVRDWGSGQLEIGLLDFEESVLRTYELYRNDADKWFRGWPKFPTPREVKNMTRRGVSEAATLTSSLILLAWRDATNEHQQLKDPGLK